jgi:hypothetical protein
MTVPVLHLFVGEYPLDKSGFVKDVVLAACGRASVRENATCNAIDVECPDCRLTAAFKAAAVEHLLGRLLCMICGGSGCMEPAGGTPESCRWCAGTGTVTPEQCPQEIP